MTCRYFDKDDRLDWVRCSTLQVGLTKLTSSHKVFKVKEQMMFSDQPCTHWVSFCTDSIYSSSVWCFRWNLTLLNVEIKPSGHNLTSFGQVLSLTSVCQTRYKFSKIWQNIPAKQKPRVAPESRQTVQTVFYSSIIIIYSLWNKTSCCIIFLAFGHKKTCWPVWSLWHWDAQIFLIKFLSNLQRIILTWKCW